MRKKKIALLFWFMVLAVAISVGMIYLKEMSQRWYKKVEVEEFGLTISYPRAYVDIPKEKENVEQIANNITAIITETDIETPGIAVDLVDEIIHAKSELTGLTIYAEAIKKGKTPKAIEQICQDYIIMFKIFNSYEEVLYEEYEEVTVAGQPAGRTEIYVKGEWDYVYPGMISYLIPLEDREITIVFSGTKKLLDANKKEIDKIINSVKFTELPVEESSNEISGDIS
ncbi:MAG: hypothetical protein IJX99_08330 [Clostridia bacterium]|nr:hypothetical protein [Clostridia bacterium]